MLVLRDIVKNFGYFNAVDHLSLSIGKGCIFGLAGPHGSGKTTVLRIAAGVLAPDCGSVLVDGIAMADAPLEAKSKIGYVPENCGFYEDLEVGECMNFYSTMYNVPKAERSKISKKLLDISGLSHKSDEYVKNLSRGMKKWLSLTRSLIHDPELLILDNPFHDLEPGDCNTVRDMLLTLRDMGKTVLMSANDLTGFTKLCTRAGVIEAGKIALTGTLDEITLNINIRKRII